MIFRAGVAEAKRKNEESRTFQRFYNEGNKLDRGHEEPNGVGKIYVLNMQIRKKYMQITKESRRNPSFSHIKCIGPGLPSSPAGFGHTDQML